MHPEDIKASLRKVGISAADISRTKKVSKMAVSHVIRGNSKSERLAKAISEAIGIPVKVLWPGKYPALEFIQAADLSRVTPQQAEADLARMAAKAKAPARAAVRGKAAA